jgi:guanylate kinase
MLSGSGGVSSDAKSCVLTDEVLETKKRYKICLIECSLNEAKKIHTEAKLGTDVNYLFVHPPTADDMTVRLLR